MRAGNLKHKVSIQAFSQTENDFGEVEKSWNEFVPAYASITPLSAKEFYKAGTHNEVTHKIEIRYIDGVSPSMKVVLSGGREFSIESVLNIREANKTLQLICTEVV